jgi:hypothetical protein
MSDHKSQAIIDALKTCGANDSQCDDGAIVLASRVTIGEHGNYFYGDVPLDNVSAFKAAVAETKPHLLPRKVDSSLADRAFIDGNMTARGQLVRELGELEAGRLAKSYGLNGINDTRRARAAQTDDVKRGNSNNPWSDSPQNTDGKGRYTANALTRQAALVRANLIGAAEIAAAVGSAIGDTHAKRRATA